MAARHGESGENRSDDNDDTDNRKHGPIPVVDAVRAQDRRSSRGAYRMLPDQLAWKSGTAHGHLSRPESCPNDRLRFGGSFHAFEKFGQVCELEAKNSPRDNSAFWAFDFSFRPKGLAVPIARAVGAGSKSTETFKGRTGQQFDAA